MRLRYSAGSALARFEYRPCFVAARRMRSIPSAVFGPAPGLGAAPRRLREVAGWVAIPEPPAPLFMGWLIGFPFHPPRPVPVSSAQPCHDGLSAVMDVDMLYRHRPLPRFAAKPLKRVRLFNEHPH